MKVCCLRGVDMVLPGAGWVRVEVGLGRVWKDIFALLGKMVEKEKGVKA